MNQKTFEPHGRPADQDLRNAQKHVRDQIHGIANQANRHPAYANSPQTDDVQAAIYHAAANRCEDYYRANCPELHEMEKWSVGFLDIPQCRAVYAFMIDKNYNQIRKWFKENDKK